MGIAPGDRLTRGLCGYAARTYTNVPSAEGGKAARLCQVMRACFLRFPSQLPPLAQGRSRSTAPRFLPRCVWGVLVLLLPSMVASQALWQADLPTMLSQVLLVLVDASAQQVHQHEAHGLLIAILQAVQDIAASEYKLQPTPEMRGGGAT